MYEIYSTFKKCRKYSSICFIIEKPQTIKMEEKEHQNLNGQKGKAISGKRMSGKILTTHLIMLMTY